MLSNPLTIDQGDDASRVDVVVGDSSVDDFLLHRRTNRGTVVPTSPKRSRVANATRNSDDRSDTRCASTSAEIDRGRISANTLSAVSIGVGRALAEIYDGHRM